jgi:hypothetical protein
MRYILSCPHRPANMGSQAASGPCRVLTLDCAYTEPMRGLLALGCQTLFAPSGNR